MIKKEQLKRKDTRYKEGYSITQVHSDDCAIRWEMEICYILETSIKEGIPMGKAILNLPNDYRWAKCRF